MVNGDSNGRIIGYWKHLENQKSFMDWIGNQLGYKNMSDWYGILQMDISNRGGATLLRKYGGNTSNILQSVYPSHQWSVWKFKNAKVHWKNIKLQEDTKIQLNTIRLGPEDINFNEGKQT